MDGPDNIVQCRSIDFILRFSITLNEWLIAFVAIERSFIIITGVNFNKKKSKLIAKRIIISLILLIILTNIFDPIYRNLFDEYNDNDDEKRIWCRNDLLNTPCLIQEITRKSIRRHLSGVHQLDHQTIDKLIKEMIK